MSSSATIWTRRLAESVGAKKTLDADVDACVGKLAVIERDVALLRKTLEASSAALSVALPRARAGMTELMVSLGALVSTSTAQYDAFKATHAEVDGAGATKLADVFARAVIAPLDEWLATFVDANKPA